MEADLANVKLTKRTVEAQRPGPKDIAIWDTEIKGFHCKVTPKGKRVYMLYYRTGEGQERRPSIGTHGEITCDQARRIAQGWKAEIAQGRDPSTQKKDRREAPTVKELCSRYLDEYATGRKKQRSFDEDRRLIDSFVLPALGAKKVASITAGDIGQLHRSLVDTPYQANRLRALISKMFNLAEQWDYRAPRTNPAYLIKKFPEERRERFLTDEELARLGKVLNEAERTRTEQPQAIAAIRLLLLTGCRLNEILSLRWDDVDLSSGLLRLPDTKTGAQTRPIDAQIVAYLRSLPWREESKFVVPGRSGEKPWVNLSKPWRRIRRAAGLEGVRIHDLRHTHASIAVQNGISLPIIAKLLGHRQTATTERYAHLSNDPVRRASETVTNHLAAHILPHEEESQHAS